jgi:hypothetical protein
MKPPPDAIETRLRGLTLPMPPLDLKRRVMAASTLAPRASWRDRAWYSPTWRLAAAATLLALLAADRWSGAAFRPEVRETASASIEESTQIAAVGVEMGLPEQTMARLTSRVEFTGLTAQESREQAGAALR